jgi:hypothetical protein
MLMASCRFEQDKGEKERGVLCWMRSMQTEQQTCGEFSNGMTKTMRCPARGIVGRQSLNMFRLEYGIC